MFSVKSCDYFSLDTEWKSELVNSRNFDKEIGHQNPRYSSTCRMILLSSVVFVFVCISCLIESLFQCHGSGECDGCGSWSQRWAFHPVQRYRPKLSDIYTPTATVCQAVEIHHLISWWSSGLVEQINNFQTLRLSDFVAFHLDSFLTIHDDYFYHTPAPLRPQVRIRMWKSSRFIRCCHLLCNIFCTLAHTELCNLWGFIYKVGDVRVRFSFAGLSGEMSRLGPAQTVSLIFISIMVTHKCIVDSKCVCCVLINLYYMGTTIYTTYNKHKYWYVCILNIHQLNIWILHEIHPYQFMIN